MKLPWMNRRDRRLWQDAQTLAEAGDLMARWLEGDLGSRPGYAARYGPDEETAHLVPTLAAACRAGYITTDSQPGEAGTGRDGIWWEQRAAVSGLISDFDILGRLTAAAEKVGLVVLVDDYATGLHSEPYIVTTVDDEPFTAFGGGPIDPANLALQWQGLNEGLVHQALGGLYLTLAAPEWGTAGERLWPVIDLVTGLRSTAGSPWSTSS